MLNHTGFKIEPCDSPFDNSLQADVEPFISAHWEWLFHQHWTPLTVEPSSPHVTILSAKISWGTLTSALLKSQHGMSKEFQRSTRLVTLSKKKKKKLRLVWHEFFLTNPCRLLEITSLFSKRSQTFRLIICYRIFPDIDIQLAGLVSQILSPPSPHFLSLWDLIPLVSREGGRNRCCSLPLINWGGDMGAQKFQRSPSSGPQGLQPGGGKYSRCPNVPWKQPLTFVVWAIGAPACCLHVAIAAPMAPMASRRGRLYTALQYLVYTPCHLFYWLQQPFISTSNSPDHQIWQKKI